MSEFLQDNLRVFIVPVDIMEVSDLDIYEQMVYIVLRSFANAREATAFPSYNTIAKLGRMSRRKAIDCVTSLVEKGLLKKDIRLDVTKNRKIRNTSNLYTIEAPRVVHSMHSGGAQHAPRVVHSMHSGGAQHAPENNHLTKPIKTKPINNNKKSSKTVVDDISNPVKHLLNLHGIKVNSSTLQKWYQIECEDNILKAIKETLKREDIKNIVGYITRILESGFTPTQNNDTKTVPSYIENVIQQNSTNLKILDYEQRKEALKLLFELGEIEEKDYYQKLHDINSALS